MRRINWNESTMNGSLRLAIRLLVGAYFLAVGLGFVPGTGLQGLTSLVLPEPASNLLAGIVVLATAGMIFAGRWVMISALCLSVLLFLSSYAAMIQIGVVEQLGQFWRDIALIGALFLAHALPAPKATAEPVQIFSRPGPKRAVVGEMVPVELRLNARHSLSAWRSTRYTPQVPPMEDAEEITNIFAVTT